MKCHNMLLEERGEGEIDDPLPPPQKKIDDRRMGKIHVKNPWWKNQA